MACAQRQSAAGDSATIVIGLEISTLAFILASFPRRRESIGLHRLMDKGISAFAGRTAFRMGRAAKAVGERGSWFATANGERLPCAHRYWVKGMHYHDPGYVEGVGKWPEFVAAIREKGRVILTKDDPVKAEEKSNGVVFNRNGYIAIFAIANIAADATGLRFDLNDRLMDLNDRLMELQ